MQDNVGQKNWHHTINVTNKEGLEKEIEITYDCTGVNMAIKKAVSMVKDKAVIKGFRKGKAPDSLIQNTYKKEINDLAASLLAQEGFLHACFENKFKPLSQPNVGKKQFNLDGTFCCSVNLEVAPNVNPTGYVGMQLSMPKVDLDEIIANLKNIEREKYITYDEKTEVEAGFIVSVDYAVNKEGEVLTSNKNFEFIVSPESLSPFGANLIGKKVGEEWVEEIVLPEEMKEAGGQPAKVEMKLNSIKCKNEVTDDQLAMNLGFENTEAVMEYLKTRATEIEKIKTRQMLEEKVVDNLISNNQFEVPAKWTDLEFKFIMSKLGLPDTIDEGTKKTLMDMSERNVRRSFIMEAIADLEPQVKISKEEFDSHIEKLAADNNLDLEKLKNDISKDKQTAVEYFAHARNQKIMDFILSKAAFQQEETQSNMVSEQTVDQQVGG